MILVLHKDNDFLRNKLIMKQNQIPKIFRLNGNEEGEACWLTHFKIDFCMWNSKRFQSSLRYDIY